MTYEEMAQSYDRQIEYLLAGNFEAFKKEVGSNRNIESISRAWNGTAFCDNSLFAFLPNCEYCASQIENTWLQNPDKEVYYYYNYKLQLLMTDRPMELTHYVNEYKFPREVLEEFKRRQLLARFGNARKEYVA